LLLGSPFGEVAFLRCSPPSPSPLTFSPNERLRPARPSLTFIQERTSLDSTQYYVAYTRGPSPRPPLLLVVPLSFRDCFSAAFWSRSWSPLGQRCFFLIDFPQCCASRFLGQQHGFRAFPSFFSIFFCDLFPFSRKLLPTHD